MVLSMVLVGVVVLAVFWVVAWQRPEVQGPIRPDVDVAQLFDDLRIAEPFPVLEPAGLADGWVATSAWFVPPGSDPAIDGGVLHVGYVTPEGSYAEVRQTDAAAADAVGEWVGEDAGRVDSVSIGGRKWSLVESTAADKQALVLTENGTTVVVTGKAGIDELEALAASLH